MEYTEDNIKSISSGEHVRLRPKLYFGCFEENSLDSMAFEIACHAFDEYFDGKCTEIRLRVWRNACAIWYDAGMSLQPMQYENITHLEAIMTIFYACTNLKKHLAVGQQHCNTGIAAINFASKKCHVTTHWEGQKGKFAFEHGETISRNIEPCANDTVWTEIHIQPNPLVFGDLQFTSQGIAERALEIREQLKDLNFVVEDCISER
ncbi:MAG: hypothetical protein IPP17_27200 [Bacteroidetes bacterium]|nr:hypothetical protein [Bacteroidota bacterium]